MALTIQDFKTRLQSKIHSGTLNKVSDINNLIYEGACNVLSRLDPSETIRVIALTLDPDSQFYTTPVDLKNDKIITIRKRSAVTVTDGLTPLFGGTWIYNEEPTGTIDGANMVFTLAHEPVADSVRVYLDGVRIDSTSGFSVTGTTLTLIIAPTSELIVDYQYV